MTQNKKNFICENTNCRQIFYIYPSLRRGNKAYCSKICKYDHQKITMLGANNPNHNNKWDEELKQQQSMKRKKSFVNNPELRILAGSANRGKTFSDEIRQKMSKSKKGIKKSPLSESTKKLIGEKSKAKFTEEFLKKQRNTMEERNIWIPLEQKTDWEIYKQETQWQENMIKFLSPEEIKIFNEVGMWNSKTKTNKEKALVRDHIYSKRDGYKNKVYPEILRHPENCNFTTHSKNSMKHSKSELFLCDLFNKIKNSKHAKMWSEHQVVLEKINEYEKGNRWVNHHYLPPKEDL